MVREQCVEQRDHTDGHHDQTEQCTAARPWLTYVVRERSCGVLDLLPRLARLCPRFMSSSFDRNDDPKDQIRDKFEEELDNILLDFVNNKLELYNKLSEDKVNSTLKRLWFNELYDKRVRGIAV